MIRQRYRVERVLGRGGMGEVLLAHDTLLHRHVALKRLRSGDHADDRPRTAILKEARRASQVSAPGIAAIYDVLEEQNDVLIVMEYVEGETLRSRTTTPVSVSEFRDIAAQSLAAVGAAHARGIVHRDLKPDNLMCTPEGRIKILDFGIARHPDAPDGAAASASTITTVTAEEAGVISGTPQYMAPEAYYSGRIDPRTDLFSLGTVFYELLTADNPFRAPTFHGVRERVMTLVPRPASELNPEVTPALAAVLARMMAKDPAQRQASCEAVQHEIDAAIDGTGEIAVAPPSTTASPTRGTRQALRVAALLGVLAAAAVGGWWALQWAPAHALPADRNLAVLSPVTPGASEDFAHFALGATYLLSQRLQKHQTEPGFQIASFVDGMDEHVQSAADAHKVLGVTLTLIPTLELRADVYRARLALWNSARASVIATREFEVPVAQPFEFLDRLYRESAALLELSPRRTDAVSEIGVHGAGTLRFMLQGIGRMRTAATETEAEKAVEDLELARRTESEASVLAWLSAAQRKCFSMSKDRRWVGQAVAYARQATARDSTRAEGFRSLGLALLSEKDDAGAVAAFTRACSLNPTDDETPSLLGSALGRTGSWDAELATYRGVIARRPHCWRPYWWLANAYFRRGKVVESIHAYREMVRHSPDSYLGYSNLGGLLVLDGAYAPAIDTLKRSLALLPTKTAFDNLGTAYFNSGRIQEAIDAYNQAFQVGFAEYDSWINLGDAYYFLRGRRDQAAEAYTQAIRLGRERAASRAQQGRAFDVMVPANLSTVFPKIAQPDSASIYLGQALATDSTNTMVQYCAALTCWQLSQPDQAIRWLDKAVEGGYPVAWLRDSPVFREWQTQPGFRAILQRSKAPSSSSSSPD